MDSASPFHFLSKELKNRLEIRLVKMNIVTHCMDQMLLNITQYVNGRILILEPAVHPLKHLFLLPIMLLKIYIICTDLGA